MDVDIAVLGGGPGGYTAAIRAAQLGARVACIDRSPELGGTCLRIGCIPTKAWAQTALALKQAEETSGKLGVKLDGSHLDFPAANEWKAAVVNRLTAGVAILFKANGVTWVKGTGTFAGAHTLAVDGGEDVIFTSAIIATGSFPLRPPITGLESGRCVDSEGLLAQTEVPRRLVILGGGVIGCEFASILARFGSQVTIIEMLPALIAQEDAAVSSELAKHLRMRGITLHLGTQCTKVEDSGSELTVHFGDGDTVTADLMLVSAGRGPIVEGLGLEGIGVEFDRRAGIATDPRRRTNVPHIYAVGDCAGHWQLAHTAFREGEVAARNACGHDAVVGNRAVPRPIYTEPEIASVGLTEEQARRQYGDDVATGLFPWVANARAVMQNEHAGWVKSIHETRSGRMLGLIMVGPHVTDMVEAGVIAIDAGAAIETVADAMAPHPTLSEAIRGAALVALGRAIDVPAENRSSHPGDPGSSSLTSGSGTANNRRPADADET
jgi:dihydrolipoamide dehydrogenase